MWKHQDSVFHLLNFFTHPQQNQHYVVNTTTKMEIHN